MDPFIVAVTILWERVNTSWPLTSHSGAAWRYLTTVAFVGLFSARVCHNCILCGFPFHWHCIFRLVLLFLSFLLPFNLWTSVKAHLWKPCSEEQLGGRCLHDICSVLSQLLKEVQENKTIPVTQTAGLSDADNKIYMIRFSSLTSIHWQKQFSLKRSVSHYNEKLLFCFYRHV